MKRITKWLLYIQRMGESVKELENYAEVNAKLSEEFLKAIQSLRRRLNHLEIAVLILAITTLLLAASTIIGILR